METVQTETFEVLGGCLYLPPGRALRRSYSLDATTSVTGEEKFADVALGWSEEGLNARVDVEEAFGKTLPEAIQTGDAVEFFVDTGEQSCHHFTFLPGGQSEEATFTTEKTERGYILEIHIPADSLDGYDPDISDRIGFAYRISRGARGSQHYCCCTCTKELEKRPAQWVSLWLER